MKGTIRDQLHQIIDTIEDEQLLETIYQILQNREFKGQIWQSLTREQQNEVLKASDQVGNPDEQTSHEAMRQRNQKWLNQ
jgi:hypothetical protein